MIWSIKSRARDSVFDKDLAKLILDATGVVVKHTMNRYACLGDLPCWTMYGHRPKQSWITLLYGFTRKEEVVKAGRLYFPDEGTGLRRSLMLEILPYPKEGTTVVQAHENSSRKKAEVLSDHQEDVPRRRARKTR
jgi:hypothetical protein